ncbi:sulfatase-like hydrolase/transferase [Streptomyces sp. NPDC002867]
MAVPVRSRESGRRRRPYARPTLNAVPICADHWRGDCLSADGHPVVRTPHLDEVAGRGALFSHAYSATPTCVPARRDADAARRGGRRRARGHRRTQRAARGRAGPLRPWPHGEQVLLGQSLRWLTDGREKYVWMPLDGARAAVRSDGGSARGARPVGGCGGRPPRRVAGAAGGRTRRQAGGVRVVREAGGGAPPGGPGPAGAARRRHHTGAVTPPPPSAAPCRRPAG